MVEGLGLLGASMPALSVFEYNAVDNIFSMTVATMGAAAIFLFLSRSQVDAEYRPALMVSGLVVTIACYHYFMIRHSWNDAYTLTDGSYVGTGAAFNDFYRYADWILTVPLLMVELVAVLRLPAAKATSLLTRLVVAAAAMIALGYPGEVIADPERWTERVVWGGLSSVPFFYILYVLWVELTKSLDTQPAAAEVDRGLPACAADHVGGLPNRLRTRRHARRAGGQGWWQRWFGRHCGPADRLRDCRHDGEGRLWRFDLLHRTGEEHQHAGRRRWQPPEETPSGHDALCS